LSEVVALKTGERVLDVAASTGLKKAIEWCERKALHKVPHDLACAPYLDEQDEHDKRALAQMKRLGVVDASKLPKEEVDYSESTGDDRCDGCQSWLAVHQRVPLSPCALVEGSLLCGYVHQRYLVPSTSAYGSQKNCTHCYPRSSV
jgi:hypothetical protein